MIEMDKGPNVPDESWTITFKNSAEGSQSFLPVMLEDVQYGILFVYMRWILGILQASLHFFAFELPLVLWWIS